MEMETRKIKVNGQIISFPAPVGASDAEVSRIAQQRLAQLQQQATQPVEPADPQGAYRETMRQTHRDMGDMQAYAIAAGNEVNRWGTNAQILAANVLGDEEKANRLKMRQKLQDEMFSTFQEDKPAQAFIGGVAPYVATAGLGGASIGGQALVGGVQGLMGSQGDYLKDGAIGTALGAAFPGAAALYRGAKNFFGRAGNTVDDFVNQADNYLNQQPGQYITEGADEVTQLGNAAATRQGRVELADRHGFPLLPSERNNNWGQSYIEIGLKALPGGGAIDDVIQQQRYAVNRMIGEDMGIEGVEVLSEEVLANVSKRLGDEFDALTVGEKLNIDWKAADDAARLAGAKDLSLTGDSFGIQVAKNYQQALESGMFDDKAYQKFSSQISNIKSRPGNLTGDDLKMLDHIKEAMDDVVERSLTGDKLERFREVRRQWRVLKLAEQNISDGSVSGTKLANHLGKTDSKGFLEGGNNSLTYDAARLSKTFQPRWGDSGTAVRTRASQFLSNPTTRYGSAAGLGTAGASYSDDNQLLGGALATMAGFMLPGAYVRGSQMLRRNPNQTTQEAARLIERYPFLKNLIESGGSVAKNSAGGLPLGYYLNSTREQE